MTKKIKLFVKGKMGCGKTTFITTIRDILKKNKKFKEMFEGYEFDIFEFAESEDKEIQAATNKRWTIQEGKFEETEWFATSYHKSFFSKIWLFILKIFKLFGKFFIK